MKYKNNCYYYFREGHGYAIRQWHGDEKGNGTATKVDYVFGLENAKERVYQLNGWKL